MARKLHDVSAYVQENIQQATAGQVSHLIRTTDEVDQVRENIQQFARHGYVPNILILAKVVVIVP